MLLTIFGKTLYFKFLKLFTIYCKYIEDIYNMTVTTSSSMNTVVSFLEKRHRFLTTSHKSLNLQCTLSIEQMSPLLNRLHPCLNRGH